MSSNKRPARGSTAGNFESILSFQRDLAAELNSATNAGALWAMALDGMVQLEPIDCGWVQRVGPAQQTTFLVGSRNISEDLVAYLREHEIGSFHEELARTKASLYLPRSSFPPSLQEDSRLTAFQCLIVLPVVLGGEVVGTINLASFSTAQIPRWTALLLESISSHVGGAWARLRAETQLAGYEVSVAGGSQAYDQAEDKFRKIFQMSPVIMALSDHEREVYVDVNDTFLSKFGFAREEVLGRSGWDLGIIDSSTLDGLHRHMSEKGCLVDHEIALRAKSGKILHLIFSAYWIEVNRQPLILTTAVDISKHIEAEQERRRLEAQLAQAARLESVGRLAGGVAHDLNNMLVVVIGHAELGLMEAGLPTRLREGLGQVVEVGQRSARLTRQLLTFARQDVLSPELLDLNEVVETMLQMLRRFIGEHIELAWRPAEQLGLIRLDRGQIDQVLMNLCVNARDAIEGVGTITIETANATFQEKDCAEDPTFKPGEYVLLSISDDGPGMEREKQAKVFDPFFTTKKVGEGTGLGLATVHGIMERNRGFIQLRSEPGEGTSFRLYFPRHRGSASRDVSPVETDERAVIGGETILVVEDEAAVLAVESSMLRREGYYVLAARGPREAKRLAAEHADEIHLLVTDVVMPEMNGRELAEQISQQHPGMKQMFVSGYTGDVIAPYGELAEGVHLVQKPFNRRTFLMEVRKALRGRSRPEI
jgi:PAS domain S-box-containing protein